MQRTVTADLSLQAAAPARLVLAVAVARCPGLDINEHLEITAGDQQLQAQEVATAHHGVRHVLDLPAGEVTIHYDATVEGVEEYADEGVAEQLNHLVPSRYAESDALFGTAAELFEGRSGSDLVIGVADWVRGRTAYISGSSRPTDGAINTFLQRTGVCRDFAHLTVAALRSRDVPARLVAVYAPGLSPMDFHAVAEAYVDEQWWCLDATGLAPRQSLLRIATGRDAADTSFMSVYGGQVTLGDIAVTATMQPALPLDNHTGMVQLGR